MQATSLTMIAAPATAPGLAQVAPAGNGDDIVVVGASGKAVHITPEQMRDAVKAFERHRAAYGPQARLVWRFVPPESARGVSLWLRGTDPHGAAESLPVPIASDGTFALPHDRLLAGKLRLAAAGAHGTLSIRPRAVSPGSTPSDFRFGDARLTCEVMAGFMSSRINFLERGLFNSLGGCHAGSIRIYFATEHPLGSVAIDNWPHPVEIGKGGNAWRVPFYDKTIANEARVRITYRP